MWQLLISVAVESSLCVTKLLELVEFKLKEVISQEPTLLVMVVGVPNVGKSALINSLHQIASSPFLEKMKRARVGPLPDATQDIAGYKDTFLDNARAADESSFCLTEL
ncbi:hypothetical protein RJ639_014116 [Escallonia herrerae]|uniref:G domain-containing protein n=1 Tax=Escallonia herrerae TaxID=1293975 RepID=A0AA88VI75_9ASTE|nr:hypothetical protein RJ639_014116 [Escallonia herrerae]